jgi:predicted Zn-dependent protease
LGLATQWGWSSEAEELLWDIVNNYPDDHGAFQALGQTLFQAGRTRSLLELYTLAVRRDPSSLPARNNVAYAALLLDAQELNPHELAQAVYQEAPANPACATTYALSLLLQNKTADAVKVFEGLNPGELENPSVAGCYGLALQSAGQRVKAKKYLEIGSRAPMLPEQRKLIEKAIRGT